MDLKISGQLFYVVDKVVVKKNHSLVVFATIGRTGDPWNPSFRLFDFGLQRNEGLTLVEHPKASHWQAENDGELQVYLLNLKRRDGDSELRAQVIIEECHARYQPPKRYVSLAERVASHIPLGLSVGACLAAT